MPLSNREDLCITELLSKARTIDGQIGCLTKNEFQTILLKYYTQKELDGMRETTNAIH